MGSRELPGPGGCGERGGNLQDEGNMRGWEEQRSCQDLGDRESGVGTQEWGKWEGMGSCQDLGDVERGNPGMGEIGGDGGAGSCQDLGDRESRMGTSRMGEI